MARSVPVRISSFSELEDLLGEDFVLFCGSAISGGIQKQGEVQTFLPMVTTITENFYWEIGNFLKNRSKFDKILSKYALELGKGRYAQVRATRKFEEFLWILERNTDTNTVSELLEALFRCDSMQFNQNHLAIAQLMTEKRTNLCITTNFDNAIETADPTIDVFVHSRDFRLNTIPNKPCLLKLHGDVIRKEYTATTPQLLTLEKLKEFSYLETLLAGKNLLVAGYSSFGDTDIAPHLRILRDLGTKLIWLVRPDFDPPNIATHWFPSDLMSVANDNCLVRLSGISQQLSNYEFHFPAWRSRLTQWISSTVNSKNAASIIDDSLEQASGWDKFHIHYIRKWDSKKYGTNVDQVQQDIDFVKKCLGVGTYYSSLRAFRRIDIEAFRNSQFELYSELIYMKGFIYWRLTRLTEANRILSYFASDSAQAVDGEATEIGLRIFLESTRDRLTNLSNRPQRAKYFEEFKIREACEKLSIFSSKTIFPSNELLGNLVILDIKRLADEKINVSDYDSIYQRSMNLQSWTSAKLAALSIVRIDLKEGMKRLKKLFLISGGMYSYHTIKHFSLAILDKIPKHPVNLYDVTNRVLSDIPTMAREIELSLRRSYWRLIYYFQ